MVCTFLYIILSFQFLSTYSDIYYVFAALSPLAAISIVDICINLQRESRIFGIFHVATSINASSEAPVSSVYYYNSIVATNINGQSCEHGKLEHTE